MAEREAVLAYRAFLDTCSGPFTLEQLRTLCQLQQGMRAEEACAAAAGESVLSVVEPVRQPPPVPTVTVHPPKPYVSPWLERAVERDRVERFSSRFPYHISRPLGAPSKPRRFAARVKRVPREVLIAGQAYEVVWNGGPLLPVNAAMAQQPLPRQYRTGRDPYGRLLFDPWPSPHITREKTDDWQSRLFREAMVRNTSQASIRRLVTGYSGWTTDEGNRYHQRTAR